MSPRPRILLLALLLLASGCQALSSMTSTNKHGIPHQTEPALDGGDDA